MNCLGIDIGSSSIKGGVLDLERRVVQALEREPFPAPLPGLPTGFFEVDPDAIFAATQRVLSRLLQTAPHAAAIFFSGQMGGTILVDNHGSPQSNYLSWRDQRTLSLLDHEKNCIDLICDRWEGQLLSEVGNELQPGSTSSLLFWLNRNGQLPKEAIPASIADSLIARLCNTAPQMDATQALGLLNLRTGTFHHEALAAIDLEHVDWPELSDPYLPAGRMSIHGREIPCYSSFGDQQCALRGARLQHGELSLNISTGAQVSLLSKTFEPGPYQSRRFFDGGYLNTLTHLPAGRSLNVLIDLLTELPRSEGHELKQFWKYLAEQAEQADGGGLETSLAFFAGPLGNCGQITGITTENLTVGNLFHACFRSMADNFAYCADELSPSRNWQGIAISGGMTRSVPLLRRMIQSRFEAPVRESMETEETLMGLLEIARDMVS